MKKLMIVFILLISITAALASALTVQHVMAPVFAPGEQGVLEIEVKNIFDSDVKDASLSLDLSQVPFSSVGSSEASVDRIKEDEEEIFVFTLRAEVDAKSGDYKIPYLMTARNISAKKGSLGVRIHAKPDLSLSASIDPPLLNEKGKLSLRVINKGKGDASFVFVRVIPQGFTLLSEEQVYIGSVSSDDFESAAFDVIFHEKSALLKGILEYSDQENKKETQLFALPLQLYTRDEALSLGILERSKTALYISVIIFIILLWIFWRVIARRRRMNRVYQGNHGFTKESVKQKDNVR